MEYLIKKTTLALAVKQTIKETGLQHEEQNIFKHFKESFNSKFEEFKKDNPHNNTLKGDLFNNYEYPVGLDDRQQYYTGLCYEASITGTKIKQVVNGQSKPLFLLQAYSKNEDPKRKVNTKSVKMEKKKRQKRDKPSFDTIKKKVKRS